MRYDSVRNIFDNTYSQTIQMGQVMWHITDYCPLNCSMCFTKNMRSKGNVLRREEIPEYIELLHKLGVQKIDLTGGEPLGYSNLPFLVQQCNDCGIFVTITSSGFGIEENIHWLCENWGRFSRVILSLDGPKIIHNNLRNHDQAFNTLLRLANLLNECDCHNLRINSVITSLIENSHIYTELCECVKEIDPREWCLIEPFPINKTDQYDILSMGPDRTRSTMKNMEAYMKKSPVKVIQRTNEDYGAYWSLYADGYLYHSNDNKKYSDRIKLTLPNIGNILLRI